jgi:DNA-binding transcriptional regulator YhcF (GntR family)
VDEEAAVAANGSRHPYQHIADVLRGEIRDGRYRIGERIPSQAELEQRFQVSRPTVQRALTELRKDGYIDNQRGRPAQILPWRDHRPTSAPTGDEPEFALTSLATHIDEAFARKRVTIDAFSLTTETLNSVLTQALLRVQMGEAHPDSIRVRLLLPALDARLAIPQMVGDSDDERALRRLRSLILSHMVALQSSFTAISDLGLGIEHSVEFRSVPVTPVHKLYLINGDTALHGFYRVVKRPVVLSDGDMPEDIFDVLGLNTALFSYRSSPAEPRARESRFVAEAQAWFDSLWSTIAEPVTGLFQ